MSLRILLVASVTLASACTSKRPEHTDVAEHAATTSKAATTAPADHANHGAAAGHPAAAGYTCPMHPEVHAAHPGRCPTCGMDLVVANPAMANKTFDVVVTTTPAPEAGKKTTVGFEVVDDGKQRVKDFEVVHEKKLHLLMVSKDLSWFAHEHPELQPDGTMKLDFTFPAGGPHVLYADFRPAGAPGQVIQKPVDVAGAARAAVPLQKDDLLKAKTIAGHQVRLKASSLAAGDNVKLDFLIVKDGKPVTDLTPYLGAQGHCVIISQDGSQFLHSHPDEGSAHDHAPGTQAHADTPSPGQVSFATQFPEPGLYKVWGQFLHGTEMIIADFVVDVGPASDKPAAAAGHGEHKH
jgi:Heavy metal binding domain